MAFIMVIGLVLIGLLLSWIFGPSIALFLPVWIASSLLPIACVVLVIVVASLVFQLLWPKEKPIPAVTFSEEIVTGLPISTQGNQWSALDSVKLVGDLLKVEYRDGTLWQHHVQDSSIATSDFEAFCWACIMLHNK